MQAKYRWAPSLGGGFAGTPEEVWGVEPYNPETDLEADTVFCGVYGLKDFMAINSHKGKRMVWWCGSDIRHLLNGYWLDEAGDYRIESKSLAAWLNASCENYCENEVEKKALASVGIESKAIPSFLGDKKDYELCYHSAERPKVYASVSGNDFDLYRWGLIDEIAGLVPDVDFYLYGNTIPWNSDKPNVHERGRVDKETMNNEIKTMQAGLRLLNFDGCSEIVVKSALWGQHTISLIPYPHIDTYEDNKQLIALLKDLKNKKEPNIKAREWFLANLNKYPWNTKK